MYNNHIHSDKIKLRRFALQLYFSGDVKRYKQKLTNKGTVMEKKVMCPCCGEELFNIGAIQTNPLVLGKRRTGLVWNQTSMDHS